MHLISSTVQNSFLVKKHKKTKSEQQVNPWFIIQIITISLSIYILKNSMINKLENH